MTKTIVFNMADDDLDCEQVTTQTINIINQWLQEQSIEQNKVQKAMLLSHIKAMVLRARTLEALPDVDPSLFEEISEQSMSLARNTVALFNSLADDEAYLLAVHYEVARANADS